MSKVSNGSDDALAKVFSLMLHGFAGVIGIVNAFVLAPLLFEASRGGVFGYAVRHYWDWLAYPVTWLWFALCFLGVYFLTHVIVLGLFILVPILWAMWVTSRR